MIAFSDWVTVERELKSGRSLILLVHNTQTGTKYIYREFTGDGTVYRQLLDVACPWLPHIEAVEEKDGVTAVLEEYIAGDSLASLLEAGPLTEEQAVSVTVQLCRALETLHSLHVVHRDVKPENVILRGADAVLIDFDVSRLQKEDGKTDTRVMGTTGYAAPEQYGFSQTDARADIYALGVLLNELLTGKHPSTELAPGWLGGVVEKCVEVNMDRRYASAAELREALETRTPPSSSGGKRRLRLWIAAAAAILAVLAAILLPRLTGSGRHGRLSVSEGSSGIKDISRPEFTYDLDGDGEDEVYLFGVVFDLPGRMPGGTDSRALLADQDESVFAAPCVWQQTENGGYVQAFEFAELMEDAQTKLYCLERWGTQEPELWASDPLDGLWNGTVEAVYTGECAGRWQYVVTASLDGELLTGSAVTSIERTSTLAN